MRAFISVFPAPDVIIMYESGKYLFILLFRGVAIPRERSQRAAGELQSDAEQCVQKRTDKERRKGAPSLPLRVAVVE